MNVIIAIHKEYADLIFEGKKTIEVRKGKMPHYCDRVFLYETKKDGGAGMIVGEFEPAYLVPIMEISPDEMSNSAVAQTCLSRIELEAYAGAPYKKLRLLKVEKATKYEKPVQLKRPGPQSWTYAREWEVKQIDRENH